MINRPFEPFFVSTYGKDHCKMSKTGYFWQIGSIMLRLYCYTGYKHSEYIMSGYTKKYVENGEESRMTRELLL